MQSTTSTTEPTPFTLEALLSWLRRQRDVGSIHHEEQTHIWQVFGYAEVERILSDPRAFSSDFSGIVPAQRDFHLFARGTSFAWIRRGTGSCAAWLARPSRLA